MPIKHLLDGPGYTSTTARQVAHLIELHPEQVTTGDVYGMLPIHYAALYGASVEVVKYFVKIDPQCLEKKTNNGSLPLHFAAMNKDNHHLIPYLLATFPESVEVLNDDNYTPCDIAMGVKSDMISDSKQATGDQRRAVDESLKMIQLLQSPNDTIRGYAQGKYWKYEVVGINSLHENSVGSSDHWEDTTEELVQSLIKENSEDLAKPDRENGYLPIHYACFYNTDLEVVKCLVEAHPAGLEHQSHAGWLPLHLAAMMNQDHMIDYLVQVLPQSLNTADKSGKTALDYALRYVRTESICRLLVPVARPAGYEEKPRIFSAEEKRLLTMIYSLHDNNSTYWADTSKAHLQNMITDAPEDIFSQDPVHGRLPLHVALDQGAPTNLIKIILRAHEDGLRTQDRYGCLPLHFCCTWNRHKLIPLFLSKYPESATVKDARGDTALDYAVQYKRHEAVALLIDPVFTASRYHEFEEGGSE